MPSARKPQIDDRQSVGAIALLYLAAGATGAVWLTLPHPLLDHRDVLLAMSLSAIAAGLGLLPLRRRRVPAWVVQVLLVVATLVVSTCVLLSGQLYSGGAFFYLWSAPYALLGPRRRALAHGVLIGVSFAAALGGIALLHDHGIATGVYLGYWLLVMTSIGICAFVTRRLTASVRRTHDTMMAGFAGAPAGIAAVMPDGRFSLVNPALCSMMGRSREELVGSRALDLVHPDDLPALHQLLRRVRRGELAGVELRYQRADGTTGWATMNASAVDGLADLGGFYMIQLLDQTERRAAEEELRASQRRFARLFGDAPTGKAVTDLSGGDAGRTLMVNPALCRMMGFTEEELLARSWRANVHPDDIRSPAPPQFQGDHDTLSHELRIVRADGSTFWAAIHSSVVRDDDGRPLYLISQIEDITASYRRTTQQAVVARVSQSALDHGDLGRLFEETVEAIAETVDVPFTALLECTAGGYRLAADVGWLAPTDEIPEGGHVGLAIASGRPVRVDDLASEERFDTSVLAAHGITGGLAVPVAGPAGEWFGALTIHARDGRAFTADDETFLQGLASVLTSAIRRDAIERELLHRSLHDPLTGLPNRGLLLDRLGRVIARASRAYATVSVLFLDVDDFKNVNDSLGHDAGDRLLCEIATRLTSALRPDDVLARFGGDEFVVLCVDGSGDDHVGVAQRLLGAVAQPVVLGDAEFLPRVSVGVATAVAGAGPTPSGLIRDADVALYRAKGAGKNRVEVFGAEMRAETLERVALANDLRVALERGDLRVAYQPIVCLREGRVSGVEALVRWTHAERGEIAPDRFIGLAEADGSIVAIDAFVLARAVQEIGPVADLGISVNVSRRQLGRPELPAEIACVVDRAALAPERLTIEVTESALADDPGYARRVLAEIATMGVSVALDDFGTGQSSLSSLREFPLHRLKLDRAFVRQLDESSVDRSIVRAVVDMASSLELDVVAEGIQSVPQAAALSELGCGLGQGFLYSPAVPAAELPAVIARIDATLARSALPAA
jgi:diguanylate cyclase (GGDEF)-like protein/PAS domain S-box-containing protein